jgi:hypothetical protein
MLGNRKLILDTFCGVYDLLKSQADGEFWDFGQHTVVPDAVYLMSYKEYANNPQVRNLVEQDTIQLVLSIPSEGSSTLIEKCKELQLTDLALDGKILLLSGGDMDQNWKHLQYDYFLPSLFNSFSGSVNESSIQNIAELNTLALRRCAEIFSKTQKPYKFLFLNGYLRPHRKYLIEQLDLANVLTCSLWSNLTAQSGSSRYFSVMHNGQDLMVHPRPIQYLPEKYELETYRSNLSTPSNSLLAKNHLFSHTWGDGLIVPDQYIDTYFSLVTETVFAYPYSFRTEKIWKPIAIGHPFIVAANSGYYRDLRNLGFKTFGHVIDETFDLIQNHQERLDRVVAIVRDLCQQDLASFLDACYNVCKYNQQHYKTLVQQVVQEFPDRFFNFLAQHP